VEADGSQLFGKINKRNSVDIASRASEAMLNITEKSQSHAEYYRKNPKAKPAKRTGEIQVR